LNGDAKVGIGGAPTRATTLPTDAQERKQYPVASGVLDYFPDAIVAIANLSWRGNEQHNAGQSLHWARGKSGDEADTMMRHFLQRGTLDSDGQRHSVKLAWRALALLQKEIEAEQAAERARKIALVETLMQNAFAALEPAPLPEVNLRPLGCNSPVDGYDCDQWCERHGCLFGEMS
jgi:hypothetical protein